MTNAFFAALLAASGVPSGDGRLPEPALQTAAPGPPGRPAEATGWYGGPAFAADAASFALMAAGAASKHEFFFWPGFIGFVLTGPVNHLDNDHGGRAVASLAMRLLATGLSVGALYVDLKLGHCFADATCHNQPLAVAGVSTAIVFATIGLDDGLLARHPTPARQSTRTALAPALSVTPQGALLSFGGRF